MKKFLTALCSALLVAILAISLTGCDKSGSIEKAFEDEGYTVATLNAENSNLADTIFTACGLTDDEIEEINKYEIKLCSKIVPLAIVVKFPSAGKIKDFLTVEDADGKKDSSAYDKAKEDGYINGNCYLITVNGNAKSIFEKA